MTGKEITLTPQLERVLFWVKNGLTNKQIAKRMVLTESTVKLHVSRLFKKYAVRNRSQLAAFADRGPLLLELPEELLKAPPFGWVHMHGDKVVGIVFAKKSPHPNWEPIYKKEIP